MMTCAEFAEKLRWAAVRARNELDIPTEALMVVAEAHAKEAIGTYRYGWPPLGPSAVAKHGDTPLLDTGKLRDSIEHKAEISAGGAEGLVYSGDIVAVYQEMGTSRGIPPRSFLLRSIVEASPEMGRLFREFAEGLFV